MRRSALVFFSVSLCAFLFLGGCTQTQQAPIAHDFDGAASSENLDIRLYAVHDLDAFREKWETSDKVPDEQSEDLVLAGGTVHLPILFKGCGLETDGNCEIFGRLSILNGDDGELVYRGERVRLWANQQAAEDGVWSMATFVPNVTVRESGAPMRIVFEVEDEIWEERAQVGLIIRTEEVDSRYAK